MTAPSSSPFLQSAIAAPNNHCLSSLQGNNVMDGSLSDRDDKRPLGICVRNLPVRSTGQWETPLAIARGKKPDSMESDTS